MNKLKKDILKFLIGSLVGAFLLFVLATVHTDFLYKEHLSPKEIPLPLYVAPDDSVSDWRQQACKQHTQCTKLAEAVFFEGRGEPKVGQYAIAFTVLNRRDSKRWPDTVRKVVEQRIRGVCQFSYICQFKEEKRKKMLAHEPKAWHDALDIAYRAYHFEVEDNTKADHYHAIEVSPFWSKKLEYVAQVGDHIFYRSY